MGCASSPPRATLEPSPTAASAPVPTTVSEPTPPIARRIPHVERLHGGERVDPYHWMRQKDAPEVLEYLRAENAYTDAVTKGSQPLQERLYQEMLGRLKEDDAGVPYRQGAWLYFSRTEKGKQYPITCRKLPSQGAPEVVILDLNEIAKTEKYVGLGAAEVSDDGNLLAYGLDTTGFRQFVLKVKDLRTGEHLPDHAERVTSITFATDGKTLFYTVEHPVSKRSYRLYRHVLGAESAQDALLFEEKDELYDIWASRTRSKAFVTVTSRSKMTTEVRVVRADRPHEDFAVIAPREQGHEYYVDHRGGLFTIRTNSPATKGVSARNFRLVTAPVKSPGRASWKELVPHRDDVMLEDVELFRKFTVLIEREDGIRRIRVLHGRGKNGHRIAMPESLYTTWQEMNAEFDVPFFRLGYASPITPRSVYDYDVAGRKLTLRKRIEVPTYDPARYEVHRAYANVGDGDGTKIPLSITCRKGTKPDGTHPALLTGYGSYGISMDPTFSSGVFSLIDRGVVRVVAHVRGGGDLGKRWHEQGRIMTKLNTFGDFIAAGEHLVATGWATKAGPVIEGGSAGGLLVGAVTNMRPDLWRAVVSHVPFVDVINTMLDETLPLTVSEFEEWGNPKVKEHYDYMMKYSPYDNIAPKRYPPILVRTSYNDSQVMYWEPAKYVARLRATKTDTHPLLLRINLDPAGHGGQSGRYNQLRETAFTYAWIVKQLGLE